MNETNAAAFSSLWFAHYTLAALQQLRQLNGPAVPLARPPVDVKSLAHDDVIDLTPTFPGNPPPVP